MNGFVDRITDVFDFRLKEQNLVRELRSRELDSSSDSDEKVHLAKPSSLSKRKLELEVETVEKKKKGRPRKDSRLLPVSLSVQVRTVGCLACPIRTPWEAPVCGGCLTRVRA